MRNAWPRTREAIREFTPTAVPVFTEVGIDQLRIRLAGNWVDRDRGADHNANADRVNDYFELVPFVEPELRWFSRPQRSRNGSFTFYALANATSTISNISVRYKGTRSRNSHGSVQLEINCNPTRTLAHLVHRIEDAEEFVETIGNLSPLEFFRKSQNVPLSSDGNDNFIFDLNHLEACLGRDRFSAFLPVFTCQLKNLIALILSPSIDAETAEIDGEQHLLHDGFQTILRWNQIRLPQVETYFERYHTSAAAALRGAAIRAIDRFDPAIVSIYPPIGVNAAERSANGISIRTNVRAGLAGKVYAKLPKRLRFELINTGTIRVSEITDLDHPNRDVVTGRLDAILEHERSALVDRARWTNLFNLFVLNEQPTLHELSRLVGVLSESALNHDYPVGDLIQYLMENGGVAGGRANSLPSGLIEELVRNRILVRRTFRRRDIPIAERRYSLNDWIEELLLRITLGDRIEEPSSSQE